jgi:hypothetical protein
MSNARTVSIWSKVTAITATLHAPALCREHTMFGRLPQANAEGWRPTRCYKHM